MTYKPDSHKLPEAIVVDNGTNNVNHFFAKGTVVQPGTFDEDEKKYLCKFVRNGLPDKDQWVHENDLINTQKQTK